MRLLSNLETTCFRMAQISCQRAQSRGCSSYAECSRDYPNLVPTSAEPRLLRYAMLGRVMMPIGTASCTACNTRFIISPSPSGLPFGLPFPFGINGRRLSIARATTKCSRPNGSPKGQRSAATSFSAFGLHHWLVASTSWFRVFCVYSRPGSSRGTPRPYNHNLYPLPQVTRAT